MHHGAAGTQRHHGISSAGVVEGLLGTVDAAATAGADPQFVLQRLEAGATLANFAGDVSVGHAMADANNHGGQAGELSMRPM